MTKKGLFAKKWDLNVLHTQEIILVLCKKPVDYVVPFSEASDDERLSTVTFKQPLKFLD